LRKQKFKYMYETEFGRWRQKKCKKMPRKNAKKIKSARKNIRKICRPKTKTASKALVIGRRQNYVPGSKALAIGNVKQGPTGGGLPFSKIRQRGMAAGTTPIDRPALPVPVPQPCRMAPFR